MDLDDQHPQGGVPFEPLSIPIFAPSFPSSTSPLAVSLGHLPDPDLLQFDYDEQIPEYSKESGSESSGEFVTSQGFGAGQTSSLGDYEELAAQYDGLVFPRRSIRERRLPPQLLAAVPLELQKMQKKLGRPSKLVATRTRGRPRKHPAPDRPSATALLSKPSKPSTTSSFVDRGSSASTNRSSAPSSTTQHFGRAATASTSSQTVTPALLRASKSSAKASPLSAPSKPTGGLSTPSVAEPTIQHYAYTRASNALPADYVPITDHSFPKKPRVVPLNRFSGPSAQYFTPSMLATDSAASSPYLEPAAFSRLKYITQPLQILDCKSAVISCTPSPCGTMIACGTILGQIHVYSTDIGDSASSSSMLVDMSHASPFMASDAVNLPPWSQAKWTLLTVLQDFDNAFVDEFWNLVWSPDSSHIIASGSCKSRTEFDHEDGDLKVLPSPLVVFDLRAHLDAPLSEAPNISTEAKRRHGIRRYEGHIEEVVSMKLWKLETTATSEPEYFIFTSSQDGHVRKWKFDRFWNQLESSVQMQDDETWMAFALTMVHFPSIPVPPAPDNPAAPSRLTPRSLFLLAGDGTLKLFDPINNLKLYTFEPIYETYCISVETYTSQHGIEHPSRPGLYLNGDGRVYRDFNCTHPIEEEPPTFLILTKGIDYLAPTTQKLSEELDKKKANRGSDMDEDDLDWNRKSSPTLVHLHLLTIPLQLHSSMVPSMKSGTRKTEIVHRFTADTIRISLETVYVFSHPLLECNFWPARLAHNSNQVLCVSGNGAVFAWTIPKTLAIAAQKKSLSASITRSAGTSAALDAAQPGSNKPIVASHMLSAIFASHDEDLATRDVCFHSYWPLMFTTSDDGTVHVWGPALIDPAKNLSVPVAGAEPPPSGASLTSVVVAKGGNAAFSQPITSIGQHQAASGSAAQQQGSAYRSAVEAAMLASVGALMPAVAKRKRGRPPKKKLIEEIEAQFAAQERALAEQQAQQDADSALPDPPPGPYPSFFP